MVESSQESKKIGIFPLFNFRVTEESDEKIKDGFQFSNKVILRQITKEEINRFCDPLPYLWHDGAYLLYNLNMKTFVFEIAGDYNQASRLAYEVLLAMRLHKTESVFYKMYIIEEKSKTIEFGCINPPPPYELPTYQLNISEIEEVDDWVSKINKVNLDKNSSFRVACDRFNRFYEERRVDDKIIDLAIAFEALFTGEITEFLRPMGIIVGLGCSMLLGQNTEDRQEIKEFLIKLFEIRNGIVHKTKFETKIMVNCKEYGMKEFSIQLQKYLLDSIKKLL
ncbi:MAG: hypothetical protein IBV52_08855 [Candidatus Bathyarchaeota archaeon]